MSLAWRVGHFVLHFLEMCLAMCVGGIALNVAFFGVLALFGVTYSEDTLPTFALLAIGVNLAIAMAVWMRFRKHEPRPTLEMASTSIIVVLGVIAAAAIGLIDEGDRLATITGLVCQSCWFRWLCDGISMRARTACTAGLPQRKARGPKSPPAGLRGLGASAIGS